MSRFYPKSLFLIVFTAVSYLITRWLSPSMRESEEITRRLQVKKVQGNVVIHDKVPPTVILTGNKWVDPIHPKKDKSFVSITCDSKFRADKFTEMMEKTERRDPKKPRKQLPKVLVIGAKKSGTGALMQFLDMHPDINSVWGEAHYFDKEDLFNSGLKPYLQFIKPSMPSQITIEKTPYYFVDRMVPPRVKCFNSSVKLILILKDPVQRLISDYVHEKFHGIKLNRNLSENLHNFEDLVIDKATGEINVEYEPVKVSDYHVYLENWLKYFPKEQFLVLDGESFLKDPVPLLREVEKFLHLRSFFTPKLFVFDKKRGYNCLTKDPRKGERCMPTDKGRRQTHPKVKKELLTKLSSFYRLHNERLFQIIGKTFSWK